MNAEPLRAACDLTQGARCARRVSMFINASPGCDVGKIKSSQHGDARVVSLGDHAPLPSHPCFATEGPCARAGTARAAREHARHIARALVAIAQFGLHTVENQVSWITFWFSMNACES
jgi:hypothetical protein